MTMPQATSVIIVRKTTRRHSCLLLVDFSGFKAFSLLLLFFMSFERFLSKTTSSLNEKTLLSYEALTDYYAKRKSKHRITLALYATFPKPFVSL